VAKVYLEVLSDTQYVAKISPSRRTTLLTLFNHPLWGFCSCNALKNCGESFVLGIIRQGFGLPHGVPIISFPVTCKGDVISAHRYRLGKSRHEILKTQLSSTFCCMPGEISPHNSFMCNDRGTSQTTVRETTIEYVMSSLLYVIMEFNWKKPLINRKLWD
jgi:hypothetical protein